MVFSRFGSIAKRLPLCAFVPIRTGPLVFSSRGSKGATSAPGEWSFFALPEPGFRWCSAVSDPLPSGCRCVRLCLRTGPLVFSSRGSKGATSAPGEWSFFALPEPGFRWCSAVSDPLPSGCRCVRLCLRTGPLVFSSRCSKGATSAPGEWSFFALPEPGFRWCSAVSDPLPSGCRCVRLCLRTGPLVFSSRGSKGATSAPGEWSFFALPEPGFRWCSAVSDPLPSGCRCVRLRLRTGPLVFSSRGSKGATSAPGERSFFALPEPGFRWCSAVSDPLPSGCRCVRLCLRTGPLVFSSRGSKGATSAPGEWSFFALPEPGFRWCSAVSDPLPSGCRCAFVRSRLRHVFC